MVSFPGFRAIPEFKDLPRGSIWSALCSGHGELSAQSQQEEGYSLLVYSGVWSKVRASTPRCHLLPTIQALRKEARYGPR